MAFAEVAQLRAKRHFDGFAARLRRENLFERRAPDAGLAGVIRPGRDQHGAALLHIARDVVEIDDRQHALAGVAIEDDQVKVLDLLLKQLAGRKRDQRQLVDRRAVLLFRRAQNREVHKIDAGVRLQKISPGALAGMRFAGNQQHAQFVTYAVDRHHGAVVDRRQLVFERRSFDFDDVRAGMRDRDLRVDGVARRDAAALQHLAVAADGDLGGRGPRALVLDAIDDGLRLANDAEARRRHQHHAAVAVCLTRSPKFWLGLLSTTTVTTELSGSRSSRVNDGFASASTIMARASARTTQPRLRTKPSSAASMSASATAPHST